MNKLKIIFLLVLNSTLVFFTSNSTVAQTRNDYYITSIKAFLFRDHSDDILDNTDLFSENVIVDSVNSIYNIVIEYPSTNTLIVVALNDSSDISGSEGKLKFTVYGHQDRIVFSKIQEFMFLNLEHQYIPFFLYDTGCEPLRIEVQLYRDNEIIETKEERISFECGE